MRIGYYVFLGHGDYHSPLILNKKWFSSWTLENWKVFIQNLIDLDVDTIMIYLNGHHLPYDSKIYPELTDKTHNNVKENFLCELLEYIKQSGIQIIGVLTTTGHAGGFSQISPESSIEIKNKNISIEDTLVSFPEHIRKGKTSKKDGCAQVGFGVLCHNKLSARKYAENITKELINSYGDYFHGLAFHPPEATYPCQCSCCCEKYESEHHESLKEASLDDARKFFITSYLKYQNDVLVALVNRYLPSTKIFSFTVPWLFESNLTSVLALIPKEITIIDWDYNLDSKRISKLPERLTNYLNAGNDVWFMPSAGFSFSTQLPIPDQIEAVHRQIKIAEELGVSGISHFLGPKTSDYLVETSRKEIVESKSSTFTLC
ncbi:hypothetical protein [Legionella spiritensis]|uniref:hypothetical protein n=1 Tax=Legionella spiritensis TaxID=452 RepID=UPI000F82DDB0|nr:hypothetical protein [Legionella spiritensis]